MSLVMGNDFILPFTIDATDLAAGTAVEIVAPFNGFIEEFATIVQTAIVTGGAVTLNKNGVAVDGASITVADAAAKGVAQFDTPTKTSETRKCVKGDRISVVPAAAFNGGGALRGHVRFRSSGAQTS